MSALAEHVREQARACAALGSPFYGALLEHVADDVAARGPLAGVLAGFTDAPGPAAVALRLAGTAHHLALEGRAPTLAAHFPSTGGDGDPAGAFTALRELALEHPALLTSGLDRAPQTNEPGRSAALLGGLLHVAGTLPVRLWEVGASAGLNLLADRFAYAGEDGRTWGGDSPVRLDPAWDHLPAGLPVDLDVVERVAGDLAPIDPVAEPARLEAYVWPDQPERLARLRGALDLARSIPVRRVRASAAALLEGLELAEGALTVVWHSVMWQYLTRSEQGRVTARLEHLGASAREDRPFAHVAFEPRRPEPGAPHRFLVVARRWPGGHERVLGEAPPHGLPVRWATA